jgi:RNA polymerase sigma-54 factor
MDINMTQNITQQQKLILTHEMQQSLKILQMTIVELQQEVARELEENPLLEAAQEYNEQSGSDYLEEKAEFDLSKLITHKYRTDYNDTEYDTEANVNKDTLNFIIEKSTLRQYLEEQVIDLQEEESVLSICYYIIDNLDENGYLATSVEEITESMKTSVGKAKYALELVHSLQPAGIGARNLKECLKIQLRKKGISDDNVFKLVDEYLELIADNKIREIAKNLQIYIKKAQEYCDLIRSLEPKPSRGFYTGELENYAIPEAYIKRIGNDFHILINENILPRLTVNTHYKELLDKQADEKVVKYIRDKLNSAVYLIKNIESRNKTIYNTLEVIVDLQRQYFEAGQRYLQPMVIADVASRLSVHESTISRAIKDKYIGTPHCTVKIKDLFNIGLETGGSDENISVNQIKREMKLLIDNEDKSKPMSDQDICDVLQKNNVEISRRTVAKYREEMGMRSSLKRKVY